MGQLPMLIGERSTPGSGPSLSSLPSPMHGPYPVSCAILGTLTVETDFLDTVSPAEADPDSAGVV